MMASVELINRAMGMQQPVARPTLRCRPDRDNGMPVFRDILPFIPDIPVARFHENEKPCFLPMTPLFLRCYVSCFRVLRDLP